MKQVCCVTVLILKLGDKKYGVISTMPLVIPEVELSSPNLVLNLKNMEIRGLENSVFNDIDLDFKTNKGLMKTTLENATYDGDYEVDGRILVLPIKGSGKAHFELLGGTYEYSCDIERFTKNGLEYMKLVRPTAKYTLKGIKYQLENLFNGDKQLGQELNKVLNENWESVNRDMSESISKTNAEVCFSIANAYITKIPMKELFLDYDTALK